MKKYDMLISPPTEKSWLHPWPPGKVEEKNKASGAKEDIGSKAMCKCGDKTRGTKLHSQEESIKMTTSPQETKESV